MRGFHLVQRPIRHTFSRARRAADTFKVRLDEAPWESFAMSRPMPFIHPSFRNPVLSAFLPEVLSMQRLYLEHICVDQYSRVAIRWCV